MTFSHVFHPCITSDDESFSSGGGGRAAHEAQESLPNSQPNGTPEEQPPEQQPPTTANIQTKSPYIPRERFDEVHEKYRTLQDTHSTLSANYQNTLTERDTLKSEAHDAKARAEQLEGVMSEMLTARVELLQEAMRDLIPDGLSVVQKLTWIEKANAKGLFRSKTQVPLGTPTNPPSGGATLNMENMSPAALLMAGYGAKQ